MLIPEIRRYRNPDIEDLELFSPSGLSFDFRLYLYIGVKGEDWDERFDLLICTPESLRETNPDDGILFPHGYLIVFSYNLQRILTRIQKVLQHCQAESRQEIILKISRAFGII